MKRGLDRKTLLEGAYAPVMLSVWDVKTNKIAFNGPAKAVSKFIPCKLSNVNSALRSGSTIQKKYKVKYASEKIT